jgi:hypothetical protein
MARPPASSPGDKDAQDAVHVRLVKLEEIVQAHERELAVQLQRIAQLQGDLDVIRHAWVRISSPPVHEPGGTDGRPRRSAPPS